MAKDQGRLPAVAAADVTIDFGKAMTVGDFIVIRAHDASGAIKAEYIEIGSLISGTNYNVTRDLAAAHVTDPVWADGTPYVALGQTGNGRIELNANDTPRMSMIVQGATYNAQTEMLRVGDLNGNWGYVAPTYGFAAGEYAAGENSLTIDQTNGIRFFGGTDVVGQLSATTWTLGDTANEHVNLTATALQFKDGATVLTDISGGNVTIGEVGASKYNLYVSGGTAYFRNNVTAIVTIGPAAGGFAGGINLATGNQYYFEGAISTFPFYGTNSSTSGSSGGAKFQTTGIIGAGSYAYGVEGAAVPANSPVAGTLYGVRGIVSITNNNGATAIGVYGEAQQGTTNWAGYFGAGNVYITNSLGIGTATLSGKLNLPDHTTAAGGLYIGSDVTLYRSAANTLKTDDDFISATLTTGDPGSGAGKWRLGQYEAEVGQALDENHYIAVEIDGTDYKLALVDTV